MKNNILKIINEKYEKYSIGYIQQNKVPEIRALCLVLFNHVSSGVHFSGAAPYFSGKIDPVPLQKWPVRPW